MIDTILKTLALAGGLTAYCLIVWVLGMMAGMNTNKDEQ